jgi:hypothetical protein
MKTKQMSKETQRVLDQAKAKAQPKVNQETPKTPEKVKETRVTKKSVTISMLDKDGGTTIDEIAQGYVDVCKDPDLDKNKRVARLWISKIGFKVMKDKETGRYARA